MGDINRGLYNKFVVKRTDGQSEVGKKHYQCDYFVLDITHDKFAKAAILTYIEECKEEYPFLAEDLLIKLGEQNALEENR